MKTIYLERKSKKTAQEIKSISEGQNEEEVRDKLFNKALKIVSQKYFPLM